MNGQMHSVVEQFAKGLELLGASVLILGVAISGLLFFRHGVRNGDWSGAYSQLRSNLGRGILLGLELLVGADIISTITSPITPQSISLLGGVVLIRTFLSFALETEIQGCWPWQRSTRMVRLGSGSPYESKKSQRDHRDQSVVKGRPAWPTQFW